MNAAPGAEWLSAHTRTGVVALQAFCFAATVIACFFLASLLIRPSESTSRVPARLPEVPASTAADVKPSSPFPTDPLPECRLAPSSDADRYYRELLVDFGYCQP